MKPSETGLFQPDTHYLRAVFADGRQVYDKVCMEETIKTRSPMTYTKRSYVNIGIGQQLVNKPYSCTYIKQFWPTVEYRRLDPKGPMPLSVSVDRFTGDPYLAPPRFVNLAMASAEAQLTVEFLNKIQERKVSLIEETKNLRETLTTIATSAERMVLYAKRMFRNPWRWLKKAYRKRDLSGGRATGHRMIKTYGDLWLEGRYHWLPTYMTMRDAFIGLQDMVAGAAVSKKGPKVQQTYKSTGTHPWVRGRITCTTDLTMTHKHLCFITANSEAAMLARRYGVGGIADLTAVVWELTPWTLVVDWVIPVSDVLLAHNALSGLKAHNPCHVRKEIRSGFYSFSPAKSSKTELFSSLQQGEIYYESYQRSIPNVASLKPTLFLADEIFNAKRIIDSLSFFTGSRFGRKVISGKT